MKTPWREHTEQEERANVLTHGVGLVGAAGGAGLLVWLAARGADLLTAGSLGIYALTLVGVYAASTLYHGVRQERYKPFLRLLDHSAVFLFIAGSYTPVALLAVGGTPGWVMFGAAWLLAAGGIVLKTQKLGSVPILGPALYLAMGWMAVVATGPLVRALSPVALAWLVAGGVFYTAGVGFYAWKRLPFNHAIWHLFVIAGTGAHFVAIVESVVPALATAPV